MKAYEDQLNRACDLLDEYLIEKYGEDAAWEGRAGEVVPPDELRVADLDKALWLLREECNSTLFWEQTHD